MAAGRVITGCVATATVAAGALLVVGMAHAGRDRQDTSSNRAASVPSSQTSTSIPAQLQATRPRHPAAVPHSSAARSAAVHRIPSTTRPATTPAAAHVTAPASSHRATRAQPKPTPHPTTPHPTAPVATHRSPPPPARTSARPAPRRGVSLPLPYSTGSASRVITVVAHSTRSTTGTLQAWRKAPGGGWLRSGGAVAAHVGSDGLSTSPSENTSATPIGSFTLTRGFGRFSDPGTGLPYFQTTQADWWISQPGSLYNTHQRCSSSCSFTQGAPNEHLYYETPYYNYAVVIDYNTRNAGQVHPGGGSAFFLHVSVGTPTQGCVSIEQSQLVRIMRWLRPSDHPRILIGTT